MLKIIVVFLLLCLVVYGIGVKLRSSTWVTKKKYMKNAGVVLLVVTIAVAIASAIVVVG